LLIGLISTVVQAQTPSQKASISGYLREKSSGEMLGNVVVAAAPSNTRTLSNSYGFFSITLAKGQSQWVYFRFPGFDTDSLYWSAKSDTAVNIELSARQAVESMGAVEIRAKKTTIADRADMSRIDIPVQQIKDIPALLGEKDVMKVIQLMPGVQKGGEGQSGIYVRGGGPDQNLIVLDEAIVYNASHLFGFF
jgi:hypothetical protein